MKGIKTMVKKMMKIAGIVFTVLLIGKLHFLMGMLLTTES